MYDGNEGTRDEALPTTQQTRTVGQRRREAEEKLEHHLDEARHKDDHNTTDPETGGAGSEDFGGGEVAPIQNDDRTTAADRVDLIADQVIPEHDRDADHPDAASDSHQAERPHTITPGPAEEEDRREHDNRGLTTDTESSD